jgi:hypothetical protein
VAPAGGRDDPLRGRAGEGSQFGAADRDERAQQRGAERVAEDLAALQVDERLVEGLGQPPDAEGLQFGLGTRRRDRRLARYQPLHAVRAELLRRAGTPRTRRTSASGKPCAAVGTDELWRRAGSTLTSHVPDRMRSLIVA